MAIFNDLIPLAGLKALFDELKGKVSLKGHDHADLTIKDALGGDKTYNGTEPVTVEALRGEDGYSPTIEVSDTDGGHQLTIKDKNGTQTVDIKDGAGGDYDISGAIKSLKLETSAVASYLHNGSRRYTPRGFNTSSRTVKDTVGDANLSHNIPYAAAGITSDYEYTGRKTDGKYKASALSVSFPYGQTNTSVASMFSSFAEFDLFVPYVNLEESEKGQTFVLQYYTDNGAVTFPSTLAKDKTAEILSEDYIKSLIAENSGGGSVVFEGKSEPATLGSVDILKELSKDGSTWNPEKQISVKVDWHSEEVTSVANRATVDSYSDTFIIPKGTDWPESVEDIDHITYQTTSNTDYSLNGVFTLAPEGNSGDEQLYTLSLSLQPVSYSSDKKYYIDRITVS